MAKEEFCMLAHNWESKQNIGIGGWYASEKLDGMRALWIPSTRGMMVDKVSFANRERDSRMHICTGLWSRSRKPIFAPDWWLDMLPKDVKLDGELWIRRQAFQETMSVCKTLIPGIGWDYVKFMVFDAPGKYPLFEYNYNFLIDPANGIKNEVVVIVEQTRLPDRHIDALAKSEDMIDAIMDIHGEGLILRKGSSIWVPERSWNLLKMKKFSEGCGRVIGYTFGRETTKGSRLLGKMGALILLCENGKRLEISGFTDEERDFGNAFVEELAEQFPGKDAPASVVHPKFPIGAVVRYKYRELSNDGVPKEARYFR